jgi:hypothetical protein
MAVWRTVHYAETCQKRTWEGYHTNEEQCKRSPPTTCRYRPGKDDGDDVYLRRVCSSRNLRGNEARLKARAGLQL